jgi:hypothetical protein
MSSEWPELPYDAWSATCDTLHAHPQVLGKLAVVLTPPEPQLQHAALRLMARGWETSPLPAPRRLRAFGVALDLRAHEVLVEYVDGRVQRIALKPDLHLADEFAYSLEHVLCDRGDRPVSTSSRRRPMADTARRGHRTRKLRTGGGRTLLHRRNAT